MAKLPLQTPNGIAKVPKKTTSLPKQQGGKKKGK